MGLGLWSLVSGPLSLVSVVLVAGSLASRPWPMVIVVLGLWSLVSGP